MLKLITKFWALITDICYLQWWILAQYSHCMFKFALGIADYKVYDISDGVHLQNQCIRIDMLAHSYLLNAESL